MRSSVRPVNQNPAPRPQKIRNLGKPSHTHTHRYVFEAPPRTHPASHMNLPAYFPAFPPPFVCRSLGLPGLPATRRPERRGGGSPRGKCASNLALFTRPDASNMRRARRTGDGGVGARLGWRLAGAGIPRVHRMGRGAECRLVGQWDLCGLGGRPGVVRGCMYYVESSRCINTYGNAEQRLR
ncbi:hypothetical protein BDY21DRAFT_338604 [Lineolata rhizophorae]|uniref:Uncharacterized protein n=1 Tax=Lineolata rhizophorae TaxID=578093 RepID=A0A6A6P741_9PEZI|nr:hypothetical protein BDY21DRAFT_338604 [Lineolata rhizophorae]